MFFISFNLCDVTEKYFWLEGDVTKRKLVFLTGWLSSHPFQCWFDLTRCQVVFNGFNVYGNRLNHHPEAQINMANMGWPIVLWSFPQYPGCVLYRLLKNKDLHLTFRMARGKPRLIWIQGFPGWQTFWKPRELTCRPFGPLGFQYDKLRVSWLKTRLPVVAISILTPLALIIARWWFHFFLIFTPIWGRFHFELLFWCPPKKNVPTLNSWTTEGCLYYDMEIDSGIDGNGTTVRLGWCSYQLSHDSRPPYARHDFSMIHPLISMCHYCHCSFIHYSSIHPYINIFIHSSIIQFILPCTCQRLPYFW